MDRCKTWTLDWTHELTDLLTPDKMTTTIHMPTMTLRCMLYQWKIWKLSKIKAVCSYSTLKSLALTVALEDVFSMGVH